MPLRIGAATERLGRRYTLRIHQPGNLPVIGTGIGNYPNHEELVVLKAAASAALFALLLKSLSSTGKALFFIKRQTDLNAAAMKAPGNAWVFISCTLNVLM